MVMWRKVISFTFASLLIGAASATADEVETPYIWYADAQNPDGINAQQGNLYAALFNSDRMPARIRPVTTTPYVSEILRQDNLAFGGFNVIIDAVLCDMNPHVCTRARTSASDSSQSVSGWMPSPGAWHLEIGDLLIIPDIIFSREREIRKYQKKSGDTLPSIVLRDRRGCTDFDQDCQDLLDTLNRSIENYDTPDYEGTISVPTLSLSAVIDTSCRRRHCVGVSRPSIREFSLTLPSEPENDTPRLPPAESRLEEVLKGDPGAIGKFRKPMSTKGLADEVPLASEVLFDHQRLMFSAMKYPYVDSVPPKRLTQGMRGPPVIGVIDNQIDFSHCDIDQKRVERLWIGGSPSQRQKTVEAIAMTRSASLGKIDLGQTCDSYVNNATGDADHGTHVVGLISASKNGKGISGINPYANLAVLQIELSQVSNPTYSQKFGQSIIDLLGKKVIIVNVSRHIGSEGAISSEASDQPTRLSDVITQTEDQVLWVAAAGNDKLDLSKGCSVHPACHRAENVLPVVALQWADNKPQLSKTTNFDSSGGRLYLGALGEQIVSTLWSNRFSTMSGTSVAAPQVSAIAGYIASMSPNAAPAGIANRILGCTNKHWDKSRKVYFGSLDAECAMQPSKLDLLYLKKATAPVAGQLQSIRVGEKKLKRLPFEDEGGTALAQKWSQYLSAFHQEDDGTFTVFLSDRLDKPTISEPMHNVNVDQDVDINQVEIDFESEEEGKSNSYKLKDVRKLVRAIH
ncbi:S8 family serine peptidase [Sinorhizobium medicae]|nr:S8 family serine peptidase [Sinorhizobium medicae]